MAITWEELQRGGRVLSTYPIEPEHEDRFIVLTATDGQRRHTIVVMPNEYVDATTR
jgi:hypothetical protein